IERAGFEENSELITAQARQRVAPADLGFQQRADLAEEGIAGAVPARVVDDLELVDVEVAESVGSLARLGALQSALEAALEFAAVDEPGEEVMARMIGQAAVELARLRDIGENQHTAGDPARAVADGGRGALDVELVAVAAD